VALEKALTRQEAAKKVNRYQQLKARALRRPRARRANEEGLEDLRTTVRRAELREQRGMAQADLASKIHTSAAVISRLERGRNVEFKTLKKVAVALDARKEEPFAICAVLGIYFPHAPSDSSHYR
jgi:ribosome-binding protein aMBF1 (putative translation factor)